MHVHHPPHVEFRRRSDHQRRGVVRGGPAVGAAVQDERAGDQAADVLAEVGAEGAAAASMTVTVRAGSDGSKSASSNEICINETYTGHQNTRAIHRGKAARQLVAQRGPSRSTVLHAPNLPRCLLECPTGKLDRF